MALAVLVTALVFSGCGHRNPILNSLLEVSYDSRDLKGPDIRQDVFASLTGALPVPDVGYYFHYVSDRNPMTAIGISATEATAKLSGSVDSTATVTDLKETAKAIIDSKKSLASYLAALLEQRRLEHRIAEGESVTQSTKNEVAKNLSKAKTVHMTSHAKVLDSITGKNIFVAHWQTQSKSSRRGGLGGIFNARRNTGKRQSGLIIMAGLKASYLFIGTDKLAALGKMNKRNGNLKISTASLQTRKVHYFSDVQIEKLVAAQLKVSVSQLKGDFKKLLNDDDIIEIQHAVEEAEAYANLGSLQDITWRWKKNFKLNANPRLNNWRTIVSINSRIRDLKKITRDIHG